ncbi:hypothetical protein EBT16_00995 [bacterium]|nr:hypothetical protein [bacterium]
MNEETAQHIPKDIEFLSGDSLLDYFDESIKNLEEHLSAAIEKGETPNPLLVQEIENLRRDRMRFADTHA